MIQRLSALKHRFFKLPDSLFGQLMLVLILGVVILQVANVEVVCSVQGLAARQAEKSRAEQLVTYWFLFDSMTDEQRGSAITRIADFHRQDTSQGMVELLPDAPNWQDETKETRRLLKLVTDSFGSSVSELPATSVRIHEQSSGVFPVRHPVLETAIELSDGTWLKMSMSLNVDDRFVIWSQRLFVLVEAIFIIVFLAILLTRVTKPINQLSLAVESFGKHPEISSPIPEKGVKEVRDVAQSFNRMRDRICGNFVERNQMIVAMAHDLRTPLTKLHLRMDKVLPDDLRIKLQKTASDMQDILTQGLELARSLNTEEPMNRLDMETFLQSIVDDNADVGRHVRFVATRNLEGPAIVNARPLCLKRCLENLISNACQYGKEAEVALSEEGKNVVVTVTDNGSGIPEDMLERVFEPYFRLETSRNRSSGGVGLGLAIARNMALLNNGELDLENHPKGGLRARLMLPLSR